MKYQLFLVIMFIGLTLTSCSFGFPSPESTGRDGEAITPSKSQLCTSFCLDNGDHCVFGTNMDGEVPHKEGETPQAIQMFVNQRHVLKTGWEDGTSGKYARWISNYGSVTLNVIGTQMVWGGMNEAGLMISSMSLVETMAPTSDARPPVASPLWVQYQLDNYSTVEEVIASERRVRPTYLYDHYLVCDRTGDCAVIEFLEGEMLAYTGDSLPVLALANSSYQDSLTAQEDGYYWKVKVFDVKSDGPAAEAGIMQGDWIIALDGVELIGEQSMETFYAMIAGRKAGDELSITVIHPGETEPVTILIKMIPLPEDMSKISLPPGIPVQVLSLGFLPTYPGDFITRFVTVAEWVAAFEPAGPEESVTYAFDALEAVSRDDTELSAVFDPANFRVYFHTKRNPQIRYVDFSKLDFSCGAPVMLLDTNVGEAGDISLDLVKYSHKRALEHAVAIATNMWQVDFSALEIDTLLSGFESFACMENNASALANPARYVESHPPLLPPLVTWAGIMIFNRLWPAWVVLTLLSLVFFIWRSTRGQLTTRGAWLVWALAVLLLGPLGLLICLLANRKRRLMGQSQ